jgi:hypothetical protein
VLFSVVGADAPQEIDVGSFQLAATGDDRIIELAEVVWEALRRLATIARRMHVGNINAYAAYVLLTLLAVLVLGARIF